MIQSKHCDLCEFPKRNLKNGLTCGLTDKKPDFRGFCSDIKFSDSFKEQLTELLNQIGQIKKRKTSVYFNFGLFVVIGLLIIFGSYPHLTEYLKKAFEPEFSYSDWKYFSLILLLEFVGILLLYMGFYPFNKYKKELNKLESDKKEIELVLKNYGIEIETLTNLEKIKKRHHNKAVYN
ncbi:hypothetical protein [Gelidibacter maritimus]|uniref:Uncharacterized protein n=1 Tax=Gelidibacter maritimus TaxID=2761487 RepID=A0A7W2M7U5_9FLAO|nr:hypothetical protein [Gelidibacter maritimus]MBA6154280.1 hypothetical protein [Gelidibacter maritimus]